MSSSQQVFPQDNMNPVPRTTKTGSTKFSIEGLSGPGLPQQLPKDPMKLFEWLKEREIKKIEFRNQDGFYSERTTALHHLDRARRSFVRKIPEKVQNGYLKYLAEEYLPDKETVKNDDTSKSNYHSCSRAIHPTQTLSPVHQLRNENTYQSSETSLPKQQSATQQEYPKTRSLLYDEVQHQQQGYGNVPNPNVNPHRRTTAWDKTSSIMMDEVSQETLAWNQREYRGDKEPVVKMSVEDWIPPPVQQGMSSFQNSFARACRYDDVPDGLKFARKTFSLGASNVNRYGYLFDLKDITKDCSPITVEELTRELKIDRDNPQNGGYDYDETTEFLVKNWNDHDMQDLLLRQIIVKEDYK